MKKERKIEITNIENFFKLIYKEKSASREEVINFLYECLSFVFQYHNINLKDYEVIIHEAKPVNSKKKLNRFNLEKYNINPCEIPPYEICFMIQDEKNLKKFEVFFNRNNTVFKIQKEKDYEKIFDFIFFALHEFRHIIQYIKFPKEMEIYNNSKEDSEIYVNNVAEESNTKSKRIILREYKKHADAKAFISQFEKDANSQAYFYFSKILDSLIKQEKNIKMEIFLRDCKNYINSLRKETFMYYRISNKLNKEAINTLKNYDITEDDLILY